MQSAATSLPAPGVATLSAGQLKNRTAQSCEDDNGKEYQNKFRRTAKRKRRKEDFGVEHVKFTRPPILVEHALLCRPVDLFSSNQLAKSSCIWFSRKQTNIHRGVLVQELLTIVGFTRSA